MRKICLLSTVLVAFCFVSAADLYAIEPGECEYAEADKEKVDGNGYIMSWLMLDPYIDDPVAAAGSTIKDYFDDQGGEANIMPKEGDEVTIKATKSDHVWTRLNFVDLKAMGQIGATVGGNELDIACWGPRDSVNNKQEYLVTYLKWESDTAATFTIGADDGAELYFNGEEILSCPVDQDWAAANCGTGKASAKGGEWNVVVVGAYETGGEWGISVKVDPIPDEVNNVGPIELFAVESVDKLPVTWGEIKE